MKKLKEKIWLDFIETFPQYEEMTPDFDSIRFDEEELESWVEENEDDILKIQEFDEWNTVENAKEVLKEAGYYTDNLWTVRDVIDGYTNQDGSQVSEDIAHEIVKEVMESPFIIENINEQITFTACDSSTFNLIKIR